MDSPGFYSIADDPQSFDFGEFNLAKVFHTYYFFGRHRSPQRASSTAPSPSRPLVHFLRRLVALVKSLFVVTRLRLGRRPRPRILFYGASGRLSRLGDTVYDLYNARVVAELGREHFIIVEDSGDQADKEYGPDFRLGDFGLPIRGLGQLYQFVFCKRLNRFAARVARDYCGLGFSNEEVASIVSAFYGNYLVDRFLLTILRPSQVLLICNYGREPFIAACKHQGIPVTELQHGTLTGHPFYIYPDSYRQMFERLLLPDRIAVYGEYWRRLLTLNSIFPEDSVVVAGYYLKTPPVSRDTASHDRTVILLTTQPIYQQHWVNYIQLLRSQLDPRAWRVVIKPHPSENSEGYRELVADGFVELSDLGTYDLLSECDIHISVNSTVLFEAVRYGVANYVLFVPEARERCAQIVASNVALPLESDQLPEPTEQGSADASFYFAEFEPSALVPAAIREGDNSTCGTR
jgi:hypothetical protein